VEFLKWAVTEGQQLAPGLSYGSLPPDIASLVQTAIATIRVS